VREHRVDTIVNFAAETHVDRSILNPAPFLQTNVIGVQVLLEAARATWLDEWHLASEDCRFHHISSDEVYGSLGPQDAPFREDTPYGPNSPYAASKASADHLVRAYGNTYGVPITLTNCSNNYGPYQFPEKLIPLSVLNAVEGKAIPVYGDGLQVRDWLHVEDHVEAVYLVLNRGKVGQSYNVGGRMEHTNLHLVQELCRLLDELLPESPHVPHSRLIHFVSDRPAHDRRYAMEISKISNELGWEPRLDFSSALRETVRWYLEHKQWVEEIRSRPDYQQWLRQNYTNRSEPQ